MEKTIRNTTLDTPLREVVKAYGLIPRQHLGQHWIFDLNLTKRIVRAAGSLKHHNVIEIGPGPGALTQSLLLSEAEKVIVLEIDPQYLQRLHNLARVSNKRLCILPQDALTVDIPHISSPPRTIVSNPPYHIALRLLVFWLQHLHHYHSITLMLQKEVAERLIAQPQTPQYSRLSVLTQWLCHIKWHFSIPSKAFIPPPKVDSALLTFTPYTRTDNLSWSDMETITRMAFKQRRKMLRSNLKNYLSILHRTLIPETCRAQDIDVNGFIRLAHAYQQHNLSHSPQQS